MYLDGIRLTEGSTVTNLSVETGENFPTTPSPGELFLKTGVDAGLHVYENGSWAQIQTGEQSSNSLTPWVFVSESHTATSGERIIVESEKEYDADPGNDYDLLRILTDGEEASTSFTDVSSFNRTISVSGNVAISLANSRYGHGAATFDGTSDFLTVPYDIDLANWYSATFYSVEMTIKNFENKQTPEGKPLQIGHRDPSSPADYWSFGTNAEGKLMFYFYSGSSHYFTSNYVVPLNQSTTIGVEFSLFDQKIRLFAEGVMVFEGLVPAPPQYSGSFPIVIGQNNNTSYNGAIEQVRITRGYQRMGTGYTISDLYLTSGINPVPIDTTINLPAQPALNDFVTISTGIGPATTTVSGNGSTINGASSQLFSANARFDVVYSVSEWKIIP